MCKTNQNEMLFEVLKSTGIVVMQTKSPSCIPNKEQINAMLKAGYKIRLNGKIMPKSKINEMFTNMKKG